MKVAGAFNLKEVKRTHMLADNFGRGEIHLNYYASSGRKHKKLN